MKVGFLIKQKQKTGGWKVCIYLKTAILFFESVPDIHKHESALSAHSVKEDLNLLKDVNLYVGLEKIPINIYFQLLFMGYIMKLVIYNL